MNDKKVVLIIEDNSLNAKLVRDLLQYNNFETLEAETAEAGLILAEQHCPDLILMDIHLPGINGDVALVKLKENEKTRTIPVIAVTASIMPQESEKILAAGFDGYQAKPIVIRQLLSEIRLLLGDTSQD